MENSVDPVHVEWLHQHFNNYAVERVGKADQQGKPLHHEKIGFDVFEHGIVKRRVLEGETEEHEDWQVGHPVLFPHILVSGSTRRTTFQIRVPADDNRTVHWWYTCYVKRPDANVAAEERIPFYQVPVPTLDENGQPDWSILHFNNAAQDMVAWYSQGPVTDRSLERLGESDQGVILYRRLLKEQLEKVERGEDPMNVFRDPAKNVSIKVRLEEAKLAGGKYNQKIGRRQGGATRFSPVLDDESKRGEKLTQVPTSAGI
jgi:5,5'-dehydrodivanillate O-demethylase